MRYLLGIDLGSSSVKVSLVDAESGECKASAHWPESEAPIKALQPGWAEQCPDDWWSYFKHALAKLTTNNCQLTTIQAIGISYQMHGLVCLDKDLQPLRDAIIWCVWTRICNPYAMPSSGVTRVACLTANMPQILATSPLPNWPG